MKYDTIHQIVIKSSSTSQNSKQFWMHYQIKKLEKDKLVRLEPSQKRRKKFS